MKALVKTLTKTLLPASIICITAFSVNADNTKIRPGAWEMSIDMGAALSGEMNREMQAALKELESLLIKFKKKGVLGYIIQVLDPLELTKGGIK